MVAHLEATFGWEGECSTVNLHVHVPSVDSTSAYRAWREKKALRTTLCLISSLLSLYSSFSPSSHWPFSFHLFTSVQHKSHPRLSILQNVITQLTVCHLFPNQTEYLRNTLWTKQRVVMVTLHDALYIVCSY